MQLTNDLLSEVSTHLAGPGKFDVLDNIFPDFFQRTCSLRIMADHPQYHQVPVGNLQYIAVVAVYENIFRKACINDP